MAQAVVSTCVKASPAGPTVAEWSGQASQAFKDLVGSYLDGGPLYWLALLVVLVAFRKVAGFIAFVLFAGRKERR